MVGSIVDVSVRAVDKFALAKVFKCLAGLRVAKCTSLIIAYFYIGTLFIHMLFLAMLAILAKTCLIVLAYNRHYGFLL